MQDLLQYFRGTIERYPPDIIECKSPLRGYHGTSIKNAKSILASGKFALPGGYGARIGPGVYFFEGGEAAIEAARTIADHKFRDAGTGAIAVLEATVCVRRLLDLDSDRNVDFIRRMRRGLYGYIQKNCPRDNFKTHPHFIGFVVQKCIGHVRCLDSLDAIRSHFAYDVFQEGGNAERGFVVFDPERILKVKLAQTKDK